MKLLLLEDEIVLGQTFCQLLEILGHDVIWVQTRRDLQAAMEKGELNNVELGIFDFYLPDGDFRDVYGLLEQHALISKMRVIVCSATSVDEDIEYIYSKSLEFLPKPFSTEALMSMIEVA